jgi:hypothetical protein
MEWLADGPGTGVETLARLHWPSGPGPLWWAVVDADWQFSPVAAGWSDQIRRPLVLRPGTERDTFWAVEQCLQCPGIGLTWCRIERAPPLVLRRWKLAVEAGGGVGMLFRPVSARRQPTWADVRWLVTPVRGSEQGRRWRVELLSCRGGFGGGTVLLEQSHATGAVHVVPELADSTALSGAAGTAGAAVRAVC